MDQALRVFFLSVPSSHPHHHPLDCRLTNLAPVLVPVAIPSSRRLEFILLSHLSINYLLNLILITFFERYNVIAVKFTIFEGVCHHQDVLNVLETS